MDDSTPLTPPVYREGDPRDLTLLDVNARFLPHEQFQQLVENIRRDGCLTSAPLVWHDEPNSRRVVLSGNHRVLASIEAGLEQIGWLEITDPLPRQRQIALQLSHNAIAGQDDPAILKELYEELESVEWRQYSGLDDRALDLMTKVDVSSLGEASLDFASVQIVFLPDELARAEAALDAARQVTPADQRWLAAFEQYESVLDALETARGAYNVGNTATALGVILEVFEHHLGSLSAGWYDSESRSASRKGTAPVESVFGTRTLPVETAAAVRAAIDRLVADGTVKENEPWAALEAMAEAVSDDR